MTTVKELTNYLKNIKEELQDKEIFIRSDNGLLMPPEIKFQLKDNPIAKTKENVEHLLLM